MRRKAEKRCVLLCLRSFASVGGPGCPPQQLLETPEEASYTAVNVPGRPSPRLQTVNMLKHGRTLE